MVRIEFIDVLQLIDDLMALAYRISQTRQGATRDTLVHRFTPSNGSFRDKSIRSMPDLPDTTSLPREGMASLSSHMLSIQGRLES